jgi:peptide/nickel transport system substrate-binding protein
MGVSAPRARFLLAPITVAAMAIAVSACGGSSSSSSTPSSAAAAATTASASVAASAADCKSVKTGGTFSWGVNADVIDMDPDSTQDPESIQAELATYDQLVHLNPAGTKEVPDLAESWTSSANGKVWTFHLRPGIKFSNGQPITAQDVAYSFDRDRSKQSVVDWTLAAIASDKAVNPTTFEVTLTSPTASFLSDVQLWGASIIDPAAVPKQGKNFSNVSAFVGSGAFYVSSWTQGSQIVLKRNPYYWDKDACGHSLPYLNEVVMKYIPDDTTRVTSLQGDQIDAMNAVPYNELATLSDSGNLKAAAAPEAGSIALPINIKTVPAVGNAKVVQALNYALDRQAIIKVAFSGNAIPAPSPISFGVDFYTTKYGYSYDLAKAKALLASTPYAKGFAMTFVIPSGDTVATDIAQVLQSNFAQIGVKVTIQQVDSTTLTDEEAQAKFQMAYQYGTAQNLDPSSNGLYCCVTNGGADSSHTSWDNAQANTLFNKTQVALNPTTRGSLYDQWQQIVMQDAPVLWVADPKNAYAYQSTVHNFSPQITVNWDLAVAWMS